MIREGSQEACARRLVLLSEWLGQTVQLKSAERLRCSLSERIQCWETRKAAEKARRAWKVDRGRSKAECLRRRSLKSPDPGRHT